ncbi:MAG: aminotransferase class V-fold PLP-dependent enzyme [Clostridiales bacterium]|jgi:cysteine desulfurase family protein|nr:aminotransferase class V-fold PLP-dependent enzyme [Eubacteriales bacterium]MDH7564944.1 aminotransferase class V-fold PLP-dependent enzyme [Clostridiales bacterium]
MIYLDNAATSYPKPDRVMEEMTRCMREYCANPGRGGHAMSIESGKAVIEAREVISSFFNFSNPLQLCFTKNATEALNIAIKGCLKPGDHVITTCMEHNSVARPLKTLERDMGMQVSIIEGNEFGEIDPQDIKKSIRQNTRLIICTLSSNVNGIVMPVKEIGKIARENGILFLVDAAQGAGTVKIDVDEINADMMAFPGHKGLLGPQGTGGLYVREGLKINPLLQGGTGSNSENLYQPEFMPDVLESGTLNTPGIVGLSHGIRFIENFGLENMELYKYMLVKRLHEGVEEIRGVKVYSKNDMKKNTGIVALNFIGTDSTQISYTLDKVYHIATRAGFHCAPLAHRTLGTVETGVVRFSVGCFNTLEDIDRTLDALREISRKL